MDFCRAHMFTSAFHSKSTGPLFREDPDLQADSTRLLGHGNGWPFTKVVGAANDSHEAGLCRGERQGNLARPDAASLRSGSRRLSGFLCSPASTTANIVAPLRTIHKAPSSAAAPHKACSPGPGTAES